MARLATPCEYIVVGVDEQGALGRATFIKIMMLWFSMYRELEFSIIPLVAHYENIEAPSFIKKLFIYLQENP